MAVTEATRRKLLTLSGNECAFPGCTNPIFDTEHDTMVGEICHIRAKSKGGPRYDATQTLEERDGFPNVMLMCDAHNKIIDNKANVKAFPVELLERYKREHEERFHNTVVRPNVLSRWLYLFSLHEEGTPSIQSVVECFMTSADNQMRIDYYDFRVSLVNEGNKTVRSFTIEVEVPDAYANPTHSSHAEVPKQRHRREGITLYRHTQDHFPGFALHPHDMVGPVITIDFQIRHEQYEHVNEGIKVIVYAEDHPSSAETHPIQAFLNKDRMDQLGLT